jgi:hypothetical protein
VQRVALILIVTATLVGCGGSDDESASVRSSSPPATTVERPRGPLVRICDHALEAEVVSVLRSSDFRDRPELRPHPSGSAGLSACNLGPVEITMDAAASAVQRYRNRVVETAQFSESIPSRVPRTVRGVGDLDLGAAGANWIPFLHQLLSARGKRVLIVDVNGGGLRDAERLAAAIAISRAVYNRLGVDRSGEG